MLRLSLVLVNVGWHDDAVGAATGTGAHLAPTMAVLAAVVASLAATAVVHGAVERAGEGEEGGRGARAPT